MKNNILRKKGKLFLYKPFFEQGFLVIVFLLIILWNMHLHNLKTAGGNYGFISFCKYFETYFYVSKKLVTFHNGSSVFIWVEFVCFMLKISYNSAHIFVLNVYIDITIFTSSRRMVLFYRYLFIYWYYFIILSQVVQSLLFSSPYIKIQSL